MADPTLTVNEEFFPEGTDYRAFCEAIVTSADVGLLLLDKDGNFMMLNPMLRNLMAEAFPEGHEGQAGQPGDVFAEDGVTEVAFDMLPSVRAMRGEEFNDYFIWMGRNPERRRALLISSRIMRDTAGERTGAVVVTRDVTEVTRAVHARENFLATVSHELRTPLTSLLGYLELAADEGDPTAARGYVATAQRNGERLLRMVDELLDAATLEHGVLLTRTNVDLAALLRRTVDAAGLSASEAGLELTCAELELPVVWLDEDRITEVLENLLTNAIKFTPVDGSVAVNAWTEGSEVVISVRDSGIGIDAADRTAIFDRFFRASTALKQAIQGVGLGLHVVKVIVEAHGGQIHAQDNEDAPGTEVLVRLPIDASGTQPE